MELQTAPRHEPIIQLQNASRFEDLLSAPAEGGLYEYSLMFSRDGWLARRRSKNRFKLLKNLDAKLRLILAPDERVYFLTTGTTVSLGEQFFVGWAAMIINRRALVFTTRRILLLQTDRKGRPQGMVSQMPLGSIASVKATWRGTCRVKLLDRKVFDFQSVPGADRKFVAKLLGESTQGTNAPFAKDMGLEHLCPHCFAVVPGHPTACPHCGGAFKSPTNAMVRSLMFPGLGDWYLGHHGFAAMEMFGSGFLWLALVILPLLGAADPEVGTPDAAYWIGAIIIIAAAHGIDGIMTRHFARKGHHPA